MTIAVRPWVPGVPTVLCIPYRDAWSHCKLSIHATVGSIAYDAWFGGLKFAELDRRVCVLRLTVASTFLKKWIESHHQDALLAACRSEWPTLERVEISVRSCVLQDIRSATVLLPAPAKPLPYASVQPAEPEPTRKPPIGPKRVTVKDIQRAVCCQGNITRANLLSRQRIALILRPRQIGMFIAKEYARFSFPQIARKFGGRDHTTVMNAYRKIGGLAARDPKLRADIDEILCLLQE